MFVVRYDVRVIENGELVVKKRFKAKDQALNFAEDKLIRRRQVELQRKRVHELRVYDNQFWGISKHDPWTYADGPLSQVFLHTSVTKHLPESATISQEIAEMRSLDQIAKARGFNGISYSYCVFPSGRVYEGRGWLVVEAATEGFNSISDSICFVGNTDAFKPSESAKLSVEKLINRAQRQGVFVRHGLDVRGHREEAPKACPGRYVTDKYIAGLQTRVNR